MPTTETTLPEVMSVDDFKRIAGKATDNLPGVKTPSYDKVTRALAAYFDGDGYDPDPARHKGGQMALERLRSVVETYIANKPGRRADAMHQLMASIDHRLAAFEAIDAAAPVVPKNLHFVWIGKLGQIQQDYIRAFREANSADAGGAYDVKIWYDPDAVLVRTLSKYMREKATEMTLAGKPEDVDAAAYAASKGFVSDLTTNVLRLQNEAYAAIREGIEAGQTFDEAAAAFMADRLGFDPDTIEEIRSANLDSFREFAASSGVELADINELVAGGWVNRDNYLLELGLRQNEAAASDMVRLGALNKEGGVYLDADLLPELQERVNDLGAILFPDALPSVSKQLSTRIMTQLVLEHLADRFPGRAERTAAYHDYVGEYAAKSPENAARIDGVRRDLARFGGATTDFFKGLGDVHAQDGTVKIGSLPEGLANGALVSQPHNATIDSIVSRIDNNYRFLREAGLLGADLADITGTFDRGLDLEAVLAKAADLGIARQDAIKMIRFRMDSFSAESRASLVVSGSGPILAPGESGTGSDHFFRGFNAQTEEEQTSSWAHSPSTPKPASLWVDHAIENQIERVLHNYARGKRVLVFNGYSAEGYKDPNLLESMVRRFLEKELAVVGNDPSKLLVVGNGYDEGLGGVVYKVARELGIDRTGIVSAQGLAHLSKQINVPAVIVPDPTASLQARGPDGKSYMVAIAEYGEKGSRYIAFGGGEGVVSDLQQANAFGVGTQIYSSLLPDPAYDGLRNTGDKTPVRTWVRDGEPGAPISASEDFVRWAEINRDLPAYLWRTPQVEKIPGRNSNSRFSSDLIIQLQDDPDSRAATSILAGKRPDSTVVVQVDRYGEYHLVWGDPAILTGQVRWQVVGHGSVGNPQTVIRDFGSDRVAGYSAGDLAERLAHFKAQFDRDFGISSDPDHISLVACSATDKQRTGGYAAELLADLYNKGFDTDLSARNVAVGVATHTGKSPQTATGEFMADGDRTKLTVRMTDRGLSLYRPNTKLSSIDEVSSVAVFGDGEPHEEYGELVDAVEKYWRVRNAGASVFDPALRRALAEVFWSANAAKVFETDPKRIDMINKVLSESLDAITALEHPSSVVRPRADEQIIRYAERNLKDIFAPDGGASGTSRQDTVNRFRDVSGYLQDPSTPASTRQALMGLQQELAEDLVAKSIAPEGEAARTPVEKMISDAFAAGRLSEEWDAATEKLRTANGLSADWQPTVRTRQDGAEVRFVNANTNEEKWVETGDADLFREFDEFAQKNVAALKEGVDYDPKTGRFTPNAEAGTDIHSGTMNAAFLVQSVLGLNSNFQNNASTAMKIEMYSQLAQNSFGVIQDAAKMLSAVKAVTNGEIDVLGSLGEVLTASKVAAGLPVGLSLLNLAGAIWQFSEATDPAARTAAAVNVGLAAGLTVLDVTTMAAGALGFAAVAEFLGPLAVPIAGIAAGIPSLVEGWQHLRDEWSSIKDYFDRIDGSIMSGGINQDGDVLSFDSDVPITEINFQTRRLQYGSVRASQSDGSITGANIKSYSGTGLPQYSLAGPDRWSYEGGRGIMDASQHYVDVYKSLGISRQIGFGDDATSPLGKAMRQAFGQPTRNAVSDPDSVKVLVLPAGMSRFIRLHGIGTVTGERGAWASSALHHIAVTNPKGSFETLWYAAGGDFGVLNADISWKRTPVNVTLDAIARTIIVPTFKSASDSAHLYYTLNGGGGQYQLALGGQPVQHLTIKSSGNDKESWLIDPSRNNAVDMSKWDNVRDFAKVTREPVAAWINAIEVGDRSLTIGGQRIDFEGTPPSNLFVRIPDKTGSQLVAKVDFETGKLVLTAYFAEGLYDEPAKNLHLVAKVLKSADVQNLDQVANKVIPFRLAQGDLAGLYNAQTDRIIFYSSGSDGKVSKVFVSTEGRLWDAIDGINADRSIKTMSDLIDKKFISVKNGTIGEQDGKIMLTASFGSHKYIAGLTDDGLVLKAFVYKIDAGSGTQSLAQLFTERPDGAGSSFVPYPRDVKLPPFPQADDMAIVYQQGGQSLTYVKNGDGFELREGSLDSATARYVYRTNSDGSYVIVSDNGTNEARLDIDARYLQKNPQLKDAAMRFGWDEVMIESEARVVSLPPEILKFGKVYIDLASDTQNQVIDFGFERSQLSDLKVVATGTDLILKYHGPDGRDQQIRLAGANADDNADLVFRFSDGKSYSPSMLFGSQYEEVGGQTTLVTDSVESLATDLLSESMERLPTDLLSNSVEKLPADLLSDSVERRPADLVGRSMTATVPDAVSVGVGAALAEVEAVGTGVASGIAAMLGQRNRLVSYMAGFESDRQAGAPVVVGPVPLPGTDDKSGALAGSTQTYRV